ncbi:MAG: hypothetical protein HY814_10595, partial [Candidatus Riflebacteria bacterium]|nr:hypothetical protein [Candidatus Riflebacteria bacterium]
RPAGQSDWEQLKRAASEGRLNAATADYEVLVPRRAAVELSTVAGEALVAGIEGGLIVNAVSSSMLLERITGGCRVTATSGNVTISGAAGGLAVQTVGGNVDARGLLGACIVDTVGGKINLILDPGNLQSARITTVVGPVDLQLPERPGAAFNLETTGGTIGGDYPLPPGSPHRRLSPARTPGPTITVRTSSGTITVRRLPR